MAAAKPGSLANSHLKSWISCYNFGAQIDQHLDVNLTPGCLAPGFLPQMCSKNELQSSTYITEMPDNRTLCHFLSNRSASKRPSCKRHPMASRTAAVLGGMLVLQLVQTHPRVLAQPARGKGPRIWGSARLAAACQVMRWRRPNKGVLVIYLSQGLFALRCSKGSQ